jgi:3',5'-nucleoside bisphosphate phosphatase
MIDLHIHTIASDGQHTGEEIVEMASKMGLTAIAVADHNSVESVSVAEEMAKKAGINFAPCIELDTIFNGRDLHILGYFIEYKSTACDKYIKEIYKGKIEQTRQRVKKLSKLGFVIDFDELMETSEWRLPTGKQYISVMRKNDENMKNPDFMEFIDGARSDSPYLNFYRDWLRTGKPAFVPLSMQPAEVAIKKIKELGGVPVLAHPSDTPEEDIIALKEPGLVGLEVYSSYHDEKMSEHFLKIANENKMLVTAGSDFHGKEVKPAVKLAGIPGNDDRLYDILKKSVDGY